MKKILGLFLLMTCLQAQADLLEIGVGQSIGRWTPGDVGRTLNLAYVKTDYKYPLDLSFGFIEGSRKLTGPLHKNQIYVSVGLRKYWGDFFMGGGFVLARDVNARISSHLNLKAQFGYTYKSITIKAEHISNGQTAGENDGEDFYLIAYSKKL